MASAPQTVDQPTEQARPRSDSAAFFKALPSPGLTGSPARTRVGIQEWVPSAALVVLDILAWITIYGFVSYLRHDAFFSGPFAFAVVDLIYLAIIVQAILIVGGYDRHNEMRGLSYTAEHIVAVIAAAVVGSLIVYVAATTDSSMKPSRGVILVSFVLFTPFSLLYRRAIRAALDSATANKTFLVLGSGKVAADFFRAYEASQNRQRLEFVDVTAARAGQNIAGPGTPLISGDLSARLNNLGSYSGVILAERLEKLDQSLIDYLVRAQFQSVRIYTLESFYETFWRNVPVQSIDPFWPLQMGFQLARVSPYHYLKRLSDILASSVLLVLCSPLMVVLTLLVWLTSGRPAVFRQARVGREGRLFTAYKFRTMKISYEPTDDIYTRADDPRVTRLGRWLRKLRLDELPQLFNVFKGDMSLIGPRAEWNKCAERYEKSIPFYHFRHLVKPGITGWAQVNYPYGESDEDAIEKLKFDLYYIRHYSLKLDAMIVLKTIHTMLFSKGQ